MEELESRQILFRMRNLGSISRGLFFLIPIFFGSCASYGPYHQDTAAQPLNSIRGPADGRYKMAMIEFGDYGSALDPSQRAAALRLVREAPRPLLFVYIHGWQNNAVSGDVCKFEHFLDMLSRVPEVTQARINVIGTYIAWRGKDLTIPGLDLLTFWNRKTAGGQVAAENSCLAAINELALAARAPGKQLHHCVLMGHSFGGLVLGNTISHSILDASSTGARNTSPWDMAVAFNSADNSVSTRQLMSELDYLYRYDASRHAYVGKAPDQEGSVDENHPFLIILQSENDLATGAVFPIGTDMSDTVSLRYHWDRVSVPGSNGKIVSEKEFESHTPGNNKYLVNFHVVPSGAASPPGGLRAKENRAFEANVRQNVHDRTFLTSEKNNGHEKIYCHGDAYTPGERAATNDEDWQRWQFVYTGNAHVPFWVVRVPKQIIWGHGGLWSDNSMAMFAALYRMHFPLTANGRPAQMERTRAPSSPDVEHLGRDTPH
jgi:hypothetical protein